jgi:hypothetical protein
LNVIGSIARLAAIRWTGAIFAHAWAQASAMHFALVHSHRRNMTSMLCGSEKMIIWGSGGGAVDLGAADTRACPTCEKDRQFKIILLYKYAHLYYLRWVTEKKYHLACDVCNRGWELNTAEVESKLEKNPIPFMTRYGWAFLVGIVGAFILFVTMAK